MESIWLYIEPFVFISEDKEKYLFYNTHVKKGLVIHKNDSVNKIVAHLQHPDHMYSVQIRVKDLEDEHLYDFIQSIQNEGYGDMIEGELPKPVIMPPLLNLQKSVERMKKNNIPIGDNILSYLHEVTIYINGACTHNCQDCPTMFKQTPCCTKSEHTLDFTLLSNFLLSIPYSRAAINITGGDPFQYPELSLLMDILGRMVSTQTFIVNYRNVPDDIDKLFLFTNDLFRLKITVNDFDNIDYLIAIADRLKQGDINQLWEISITSELEYEKAEQLNEQLTQREIEVNIKPFYNGENSAFFDENILINQDDLLSLELDRQEVFALQAINTHDFGKITILSDGKIYANVNREPIGTIQEPIRTILCDELESGTSWRSTRYGLKPCSECCFKLICPSPSNYELVFAKPNLCHII